MIVDELELKGHWNYFLSLENDIANTSRFVEPSGQENVYSFEFAKILILACTEVETVFRNLCEEISGTKVSSNMGDYKSIILTKYPKIVDAEVTISRLYRNIRPFEGWDVGKLLWWDAYQGVKHDRGKTFDEATYMNAVTALSALYILIFYLAKTCNISFKNYESKYFDSEYENVNLLAAPFKQLPDFQ